MAKSKTTQLAAPMRGVPIPKIGVYVEEGGDEGTSIGVESERLTIGTAEGNDLVLSDGTVSRYHLELERTDRGVYVTDLKSTNGTFAGNVCVEKALVPVGTVLRIGRTKVRIDDGGVGTADVFEGEELEGMVGTAHETRRLMAQIAKVAETQASVLIIGESGTGKELVARAIHRLSDRSETPYEIVDCASLSPQLIASELFGHEKGSFTGADRRHVGAFERAHGGTLFLDEIGELPAELQPTLLGALERRRFRRVGGRDDLAVDVRVVSATNRDLRTEVNTNSFRLDLFYRLAVVTLRIPPLRERVEDIPLLVQHFARAVGYEGAMQTLFPPETMAALQKHPWPGNVRELRNLVEATVAMGETPALHVPPESGDPDEDGIGVNHLLELPYKEARGAVLDEFEARYLPHLLERATGNVSEAARKARMDRSYLFSLLRKHGLR